MKQVNINTYEVNSGISFYLFVEELLRMYDKRRVSLYGIFNEITLIVDASENEQSLFWQYQYKNLLKKTNKIL